MARLIRIYDTTLRDGTQGEGVSFSMEDKVRLAQRLDALGVHYIEGGWPGSNPKDMRFFRRILDVPLKHARVAAFGATTAGRRRRRGGPEPPGPRRGAHPGGDDLREVLALPRHARPPDDPAREPPHDPGLGGVPRPARRGGRVRRRALLRRVQARPRLRAGDPARGRARRRPLPRALRHQRRHAALGGGRDRARDAAARPGRRSGSTPTTTASARSRTRWPRSWRGRSTSRGRSTGSGSAAGTPTSCRSSRTSC